MYIVLCVDSIDRPRRPPTNETTNRNQGYDLTHSGSNPDDARPIARHGTRPTDFGKKNDVVRKVEKKKMNG